MNSLLKRTTGDDAGPKLDINRYKREGKLEETQNSSNINLITCINITTGGSEPPRVAPNVA